MGKTREVAETMAAKPAMAMRLTKARFRQVTQPAFDEAFENGGIYQAEAFASGEPQAAMRVFFAERAARRKARGDARGKG
jgi:enoyl-CoA hydratase/carnithine racemase